MMPVGVRKFEMVRRRSMTKHYAIKTIVIRESSQLIKPQPLDIKRNDLIKPIRRPGNPEMSAGNWRL